MGPLVTDGRYDVSICKGHRTIEIRAYKKKKIHFFEVQIFCEIILQLPSMYKVFFSNIHSYFSITFVFGMIEQVTKKRIDIKLIKKNETMRIQVKKKKK